MTAPLPQRLAIVGTAGHIDHGKTALVRRADRRRHRPAARGEGARHHASTWASRRSSPRRACTSGIVDVPGHERFVKNMVAGAGGIDLVMLVIAADEGVMPQTREHLAIVRLLGVQRGDRGAHQERPGRSRVGRRGRARRARRCSRAPRSAEAPIVRVLGTTGAGQADVLARARSAARGDRGRRAARRAGAPADRSRVHHGGLRHRRDRHAVARHGCAPATRWRCCRRAASVRVRRVQVHGQTVGRSARRAAHGAGDSRRRAATRSRAATG